MSFNLTKCAQNLACECTKECRKKVKAGSTTPNFVRMDLVRAIKDICRNPYVSKGSWKYCPPRSPSA